MHALGANCSFSPLLGMEEAIKRKPTWLAKVPIATKSKEKSLTQKIQEWLERKLYQDHNVFAHHPSRNANGYPLRGYDIPGSFSPNMLMTENAASARMHDLKEKTGLVVEQDGPRSEFRPNTTHPMMAGATQQHGLSQSG